MKNYVIVHVRRMDCDGPLDYLLLIHKQKPEWQKGRLNLVGGKIEEGEDPIAAAVRELKEEAGFDPIGEPLLCGAIIGEDWTVHCVLVDIDDMEGSAIVQRPEETEKVEWFPTKEGLDDPRLMPNLRVIIPLLQMRVTGWEITESDEGFGFHVVNVWMKNIKALKCED
jgi:8-oxo-dGTP pyrophosphatase MutT (NUDIX family)